MATRYSRHPNSNTKSKEEKHITEIKSGSISQLHGWFSLEYFNADQWNPRKVKQSHVWLGLRLELDNWQTYLFKTINDLFQNFLYSRYLLFRLMNAVELSCWVIRRKYGQKDKKYSGDYVTVWLFSGFMFGFLSVFFFFGNFFLPAKNFLAKQQNFVDCILRNDGLSLPPWSREETK